MNSKTLHDVVNYVHDEQMWGLEISLLCFYPLWRSRTLLLNHHPHHHHLYHHHHPYHHHHLYHHHHHQQWKEASHTTNEGGVNRVYTICNMSPDPPETWLVTPFIPREYATNRIYIEVKFSMRKCTKATLPSSAGTLRVNQCESRVLFSRLVIGWLFIGVDMFSKFETRFLINWKFKIC